jgi:hypothetical protein
MIRGLEKNFFAALGYRLDKALLVGLGIVVVVLTPYLGLFVGPWWAKLACGLGVASIATTLAASYRHSGIDWYYALLMPFAAVAVLVSLGRSVVLTLLKGGVNWRGRLYPLRELKAHVRLRDAWAREVWRSTR